MNNIRKNGIPPHISRVQCQSNRRKTEDAISGNRRRGRNGVRQVLETPLILLGTSQRHHAPCELAPPRLPFQDKDTMGKGVLSLAYDFQYEGIGFFQ